MIDNTQLKETSSFIYKILLAIGLVVMFIVGTILGIQFMVSSAEEKAKVKEALVPYIVGCFVIFGAFTIWSIVVNFGQDVSNGVSAYTTYSEKYQCQICETILPLDYYKGVHNGYDDYRCPTACGADRDMMIVVCICNNCGETLVRSDVIADKQCSYCGAKFTN